MTQKRTHRHSLPIAVLAGACLISSGCMVGPKYQRPTAPMPIAYKEAPPEGWKEASPSDDAIKGKWWEIYEDPDLNALEEQVSISNQNVLAAEAQFRQARDAVRVARSALFPILTAGGSISDARSSTSGLSTAGRSVGAGVRNTFVIPSLDFSYQADLWGSIRRNIRATAEVAQATAAQLENVRLLYQAELAQDFFTLHGLDGDDELLQRTVKSYEEYLTLTKNRFAGGVATGGDVAQAETQLNTARSELVELGVGRAQLEHAIAILIGKPPFAVSIPPKLLTIPPPQIPLVIPSTLLERRPDIAASERNMAALNEQIGIAQAAFYPALSLTASAGLQGTSLANLFNWPSRFWSIGPGLTQTIFDAGRRRGVLAQATDAFDVAVANYRQTVLNAFQQVEDSLSTLRILQNEAEIAEQTVQSAEQSLQISTFQYKAGTVTYLQVITTQAIALQNQRLAIDLLTRRLTSSVLLVEALGGGWDSSQLPTIEQLTPHRK